MTFRTLIRRSLRFHARAHLGVVLGATIGSAALIGALVVGDSVRESLRERALSRLGKTHFALRTQDRLFQASLRRRVNFRPTPLWAPQLNPDGHSVAIEFGPRAVALDLVGVVSSQGGGGHANRVHVLGVGPMDWSLFANWRQLATNQDDPTSDLDQPNTVLGRWNTGQSAFLNTTLARQLGVVPGKEVVVRIHKPSLLGPDAAINSSERSSVALRLRVGAILSPEMLGDFSLTAQRQPPASLFLPIGLLQDKLGFSNQANLLVSVGIDKVRQPAFLDGARKKISSWARSLSRHGKVFEKMASALEPGAETPVPDDEALGLATAALERGWLPEDAGLSVRVAEEPESIAHTEHSQPAVEIVSSRVFLGPAVALAALDPRANLITNRSRFVGGFPDQSLGSSATLEDTPSDLALSPFVTNGFGVLTYLANQIHAGERTTPYSMVTAADGPYAPADMRNDEILLNQWLADDLQVKPGDPVQLSYYVVDSGAKLIERTNTFRVRAIVPMTGIYADRTLMPEFPGVAKAESTSDWNVGFPLDYKIRDKDEAYWHEYRGTPKAFIKLAAGQAMWANRFGSLTAIRYQVPTNMEPSVCQEVVYRNLIANLNPAELGLRVEPVREQALKAADQSQDFGQLFLGFSFFLVIAALLLMALLFQFNLEQRAREIGTFLALGFTPKQVRRLLLGEGVRLALLGGILGALAGLGYAKAMVWGLTTVWRNAVGESALQFHATFTTLLIGVFASTVVATFTIWLALRRQARQPIVALLAREAVSPKSQVPSPKSQVRKAPWFALLAGGSAIAIVGWALAKGDTANAGAFFGAGSLLLIAGLAAVSAWLRQLSSIQYPASRIQHLATSRLGTWDLGLGTLGVRSCSRRRTRSLATVALLACGSFVIVSIGVFRLDANRDASQRTSGTGGFALMGETTMPVGQDLNTSSGQESFGLSPKDLAGVRFVPFRLREGDDASCLNLNHAQKPRLLGVRLELLAGRFTFAKVASGAPGNGWELLRTKAGPAPRSDAASIPPLHAVERGPGGEVGRSSSSPPIEIPAIGDANSIEWALGKKVGDTLDYTDERGQTFKLRLVGAVANSILQGNLIIDEAAFTQRFPNESGYRFFLLDAPSNSVAQVSRDLSRAMEDVGLELTPTAQRLAAFNAVQNTYLGTFQVLGGLGLLLGSAGLGVVVLRNVLERRGELGVLVAVGFRRRMLQRLVLSEHGALLGLGLAIGIFAAAVSVLPALLSPGMQLPYSSLAVTLAAVLLNGLAWAWLATRFALRGDLLAALREE